VATRGGNRNDPNILNAYDDNPLSTADRPWSYRVSGNYELPWQFFVSGTWQHQIGAPETTTVSVTNATVTLAQGTQVVQVAPLGDVRFPNVAQLDLNIRKTFTIPGSSQRLTPRVEIFNATNASLETGAGASVAVLPVTVTVRDLVTAVVGPNPPAPPAGGGRSGGGGGPEPLWLLTLAVLLSVSRYRAAWVRAARSSGSATRS
jgi:hypothetical protein